jgi:hypothetical protein
LPLQPLKSGSLSKKFTQFGDYKANVPFLLPIKNPKRVSEVLFTVLLVVGLCVLLYVLPYDLIRRFSVNFIPQVSWLENIEGVRKGLLTI